MSNVANYWRVSLRRVNDQPIARPRSRL